MSLLYAAVAFLLAFVIPRLMRFREARKPPADIANSPANPPEPQPTRPGARRRRLIVRIYRMP